MAITREKKEELVQKYAGLIEHSSALIFTDFRGTRVSQIQSLRSRMREIESPYFVVKNSLMRIALNQAGRAVSDDLLSGTRAVAFIGEDIGTGVKALKEWIKDAKVVVISGAILEGSVLDADRAEALADLPSREQLLSKLLGTINAPATDLARMISAPQSSLVRVLNAHVEKRKEAA